jgi:hypothetical protein
MLIPDDLLMVKLLSVTAGRLVEAPEPPKIISELPPPVRLPPVTLTAPFSVSVFDPNDNAPLVRYNIPLTVLLPDSEIPADLLIVRSVSPFVTEGRLVEEPLPPKIMQEVVPPCIFPLVWLIVPFTVRV